MSVFFEDVKVGDEIPPLVKEITDIQLNMFSAAMWSFYRLHWDEKFAQEKGFPHPNVQASLYGAFLSQLLTDWMGPDGALKKLGYNNRVMCYPGDTLTCKGKVTGKYVNNGGNFAECDVWVENQKGHNVSPGTATISLPSKG